MSAVQETNPLLTEAEYISREMETDQWSVVFRDGRPGIESHDELGDTLRLEVSPADQGYGLHRRRLRRWIGGRRF